MRSQFGEPIEPVDISDEERIAEIKAMLLAVLLALLVGALFEAFEVPQLDSAASGSPPESPSF